MAAERRIRAESAAYGDHLHRQRRRAEQVFRVLELFRAEEIVKGHAEDPRRERPEIGTGHWQPGGELVAADRRTGAVAGVQVQLGGAMKEASRGVVGKAAALLSGSRHPAQADAANARSREGGF